MCYWTFAFFYFHCVLFNIVFQVLVKGCLTSQGHRRAQPWTMLTSCQRIEFCFKTNFDLPHVFSISVVFFCLCCVLLVFYCFLFYFSQLFLLFCLTSVLFLFNFHCGVFILKFCFVQPLFFFSYLSVTSVVFISVVFFPSFIVMLSPDGFLKS